MRPFQSLTRRSLLKTAGVAAGSTSLWSIGAEALDMEFDRTVDIVEAGADDTGSEPIDDVFADVAEDGVLVEFPDGEYRVDQLSLYDLQNAGLVATGDATLVATDASDDDLWIGGAQLEKFVMQGFTFDHTADGVSPLLVLSGSDDIVLRDIEKVGVHDGSTTAFSVRVEDSEGSALVENVRAPDGSGDADATGFYINTTGTVTVRDCEISGFVDNGLYASNSSGEVHVEGGRFANNDVAQVRLGSPGSYVKGASIAVDRLASDDANMRGIRIADGPGPVTVEDCDIRLAGSQGTGGIVGAYSGGSFTVRKTAIHIDADYTTVGSGGTDTSYAVLVDDASGVDDPGTRTLQDVVVTGSGTDHAAMLFRRDGNTLENLCVEQTGEDRDGLVFADGSDNTVTDADIEVPGAQFVGDVETSDIGSDADCTAVKERWEPESDDTSGTDDGSDEQSTESDQESTDDEEQADEDSTEADGSTDDGRRWSDLQVTSHNGYPGMGTDEDNPTAVFYGNFKCPYTREFVEGNLRDIVDEFVRSGELNIRHRTLAYEADDPDDPLVGSSEGSELAARYALAVWDLEPENYWPFVAHVYHNQPDGRWVTTEQMVEFMKAAGVRNWGRIRWLIDEGYYRAPVHRTTAAARADDIALVPRLVIDGDAIAPHRDTETVLEWIRDRL